MSARKILSCTSCRRRKIKCERTNPCGPCLESGIESIYPTRRVRASRGKTDALKARDDELLDRIRDLESMLAERGDFNINLQADRPLSGPPRLITDSTMPRSSKNAGCIEAGVSIDDHYSAFIRQQNSSSRHINEIFWSNLNSEVAGLRQIIEGDISDADDFRERDWSSTDTIYPLTNFIFQDPGSIIDVEVTHPPNAHSVVLFQFYFKNVDPLRKILHRPTVNSYYSNLRILFDQSCRRFKFRSLEAVTFAMYFAAVTSMTSEECVDFFGEDRSVLSMRYKRYTELVLKQADFMDSLELTTLQALTI